MDSRDSREPRFHKLDPRAISPESCCYHVAIPETEIIAPNTVKDINTHLAIAPSAGSLIRIYLNVEFKQKNNHAEIEPILNPFHRGNIVRIRNLSPHRAIVITAKERFLTLAIERYSPPAPPPRLWRPM